MLLSQVLLSAQHGVMRGGIVTGTEAMSKTTTTRISTSITILTAGIIRGKDRPDGATGSTILSTARALPTVIRGRHRSITREPGAKPQSQERPLAAAQSRARGKLAIVPAANKVRDKLAIAPAGNRAAEPLREWTGAAVQQRMPAHEGAVVVKACLAAVHAAVAAAVSAAAVVVHAAVAAVVHAVVAVAAVHAAVAAVAADKQPIHMRSSKIL